MTTDLDILENNIGYSFNNRDYLVNALTHTSYAHEHTSSGLESNERLEFLGDAILQFVSSKYLYINNPQMPEGKMSKLRAALVCEQALAEDARKINLPSYILLGKGEEKTGRNRDSIVSDAMESLIGAIFLDGGIDRAETFVKEHVLNDIDKKTLFYDSKTILQERIYAVKAGEISYEIIDESGPDHLKSFTAAVKLNGKIIGTGSGNSKKNAQQQAAFDALQKL